MTKQLPNIDLLIKDVQSEEEAVEKAIDLFVSRFTVVDVMVDN